MGLSKVYHLYTFIFHLLTLEHRSPLPSISSPTRLNRAPGSLAVVYSVFYVFRWGLGGSIPGGCLFIMFCGTGGLWWGICLFEYKSSKNIINCVLLTFYVRIPHADSALYLLRLSKLSKELFLSCTFLI